MRAIYGACCVVVWMMLAGVLFGDEFLFNESKLLILTAAIAFAGGAAGGV